MNQELKHRLIGAVVITALATIFIPMLFDDPIDDTGQLVSELKIPAEPENSAAAKANKSPTSIDQVLEKPDGESESPVNGQNAASALESGNADSSPIDETDQAANNSIDQSQASDISDTYAEEEMAQDGDMPENDPLKQNQEPGSLDTGVIEEANHSVKADKIDNGGSEANQGQNTSKPINTDKSLNNHIIVSAKKAVKEPAIAALKPAIPQSNITKPLISAAANEVKKPANNTKDLTKKPDQQLVRWYLQAGSFGRKDNALSQLEALKKQGIPVQLETVQSDKGALYRVKVGPELSKKRAADMKAKLEKQKINTMLIAE